MSHEPPPLPYRCAIPADPEAPLDLRAIPSRSGVYVLEDDQGRTVAMATTANLRRGDLRARLQPTEERSRRVDYRAISRSVLATTVGSAFEADWAYLQLARDRLPHTVAALTDRWATWWVTCDPSDVFPRFVKAPRPTDRGVSLGPFPDKHAAQRYIELLWSGFDLCRYHHLLIQTPDASACAYKEIDRCPAPCDGTVSMDAYRRQISDAIAFACTPIDRWRGDMAADMQEASVQLEFERADRLKRRLEDTRAATKPQLTHVDRFERFEWLGVFPTERPGAVRIFLVHGGDIDPVVDIPIEPRGPDPSALRATLGRLSRPESAPAVSTDADVQNMALMCTHLFRPASRPSPGGFVRLDTALVDPAEVAKLARRAASRSNDETEATLDERMIESDTEGRE